MTTKGHGQCYAASGIILALRRALGEAVPPLTGIKEIIIWCVAF